MNKNAAIVMTSIAAPTAAMQAFAEGCRKTDTEFIVIGDRKSPADFHLDGCRYISPAEQGLLPVHLAHLLPENHYSRKNLGYLLCKDRDVIIETDDDNHPLQSFWSERQAMLAAPVVRGQGWVNAYRFFSESTIWPRGFPLEEIHGAAEDGKDKLTEETVFAPIQQGLTDGDPDVDAIYRMTRPLPVRFAEGRRIALAPGSWCPFNSQNTTWFRPAFILMYLPSTCSFRMTDIWRSFVAQRIAATCGWNILFHSPTVEQLRNPHDLAGDFAEEISGYLSNNSICRQLASLDLPAGEAHLAGNLLRCYRMLVEQKHLSPAELPLLEAWIAEFH